MRKAKKEHTEAEDWRTGTASEFLELTAEEAAFVEVNLALAHYLRELRMRKGWTQTQVAKRLGSSQSRVAKMEAADASVSVDLLVRSLFVLGVSGGKWAVSSQHALPKSSREPSAPLCDLSVAQRPDRSADQWAMSDGRRR